MKVFKFVFVLLLASCSNQALYESIQNDIKNKCTQEPSPSLREKCEQDLLPYRDYKKLKEEN